MVAVQHIRRFSIVRQHDSVANTQRIVDCRPRICGSGSDGVRRCPR